MNIVCGDALGISCGTWIAFWNGSVGAFVAAIVSVVVALGVVELTRRHQDRQADKAREIRAMANLIALLQSIPRQFEEGKFDPDAVRTDLESAMVRLQLSSPAVRPIITLMHSWPYRISACGIVAEKLEGQGSSIAASAQQAASGGATVAALHLRAWFSMDSNMRERALEDIRHYGDLMLETMEIANVDGTLRGLNALLERPRPRARPRWIAGSRRLPR